MAEEKHIILVGAGGCMRELVWQIQELNKECPAWKIDGYVDAKVPKEECVVGTQLIPFLGTDEYLLTKQESVNAVLCVGSPSLRKKIVDNLKKNPKIQFPNLFLGDTKICEDVKMGEGCIISMDARISTNVQLGDFVFLNTGSMVCHDGRIGDFVTLSPDVKLAGNVKVGSLCEIGMGAKVIQGISIHEKVMVGAGCVVVKDIGEEGTFVGVPARKL